MADPHGNCMYIDLGAACTLAETSILGDLVNPGYSQERWPYVTKVCHCPDGMCMHRSDKACCIDPGLTTYWEPH